MVEAIKTDAIPQALKAIDQWVVWRSEERPTSRTGELKITKVPYQVTGAKASSTNPTTWTTFERAVTAYRRGESFAGVGFVLTKEIGIVGVDLDHCRDAETAAIEPWAQAIVDRLDSYTEITPSQRGLRIFMYGRLPSHGRKKGNIEMYDSGRFLTVTGLALGNEPWTIQHRQTELEAIHAELFGGSDDGNRKDRLPPHPITLDDQELIERALRAGNGDNFRRLWEGDTTDYASPSEADLALCSYLSFWTGGDAARIDGLLRKSGLYRDKWDERHGQQTYGAMTIGRALQGATEFYQPGAALPWAPPSRNGSKSDGSLPTSEEREIHFTDLGNSERMVHQHGDDLRFCHPWGKWLVWDGRRFRDDSTGEIYRRAAETVREMYRQASELEQAAAQATTEERRGKLAEAAERLSSWARKSESRSRIEAMVKLAESRPGIPVLPGDLDTDKLIMNVANGTVNLRSSQLQDHRREDLISKLSPVDYDPEARCPLWDAFLDRVLAGSESMEDHLARAVGVSLTGDVEDHRLIILYGSGRNGKTTFLVLSQLGFGNCLRKRLRLICS